MIRLDVEQYCHECPDFEPDVQRPEKDILYGSDPSGRSLQLVSMSDTIIRCKYRDRCRALSRYLEKQKA